jgi:hypothetical protein
MLSATMAGPYHAAVHIDDQLERWGHPELSKKDDAKHGFCGLVAQKAKVILDENGTPRESHRVRHLKPKEKKNRFLPTIRGNNHPSEELRFDLRCHSSVFVALFDECSVPFDFSFCTIFRLFNLAGPTTEFEVRRALCRKGSSTSEGRSRTSWRARQAFRTTVRVQKEGPAMAMGESKPNGGEAVIPAVRSLQIRRKTRRMDLRARQPEQPYNPRHVAHDA